MTFNFVKTDKYLTIELRRDLRLDTWCLPIEVLSSLKEYLLSKGDTEISSKPNIYIDKLYFNCDF